MSTPSPTESRRGLFASLRALGDGVLLAVQHRLELFALELHEEKLRLVQTLIWISAIMFAAVMAVSFASITLVYLFWEDARLTVLVGLAVFYICGLVVLAMRFRRYLGCQPRPFSATLGELEQDRTCTQRKN